MDKGNGTRRAALIAKLKLHPEYSSAGSIKILESMNNDDLQVRALAHELRDQAKCIHNGDLERAETMLVTQAHTLDALFANLMQRSEASAITNIHAAEKLMRLALRAQAQCRMTLGTLAEIKNPKPYIHQQNMAYNQQINNEANSTRGRKNLKTTTELLEDDANGQKWVDARTPQKTSKTNTELETLGEQHRSEN